MNSGLSSLYKILKDETRQQIITLLATKGSLSYTELMQQLDVLTGILNYHLKVLGDLLQKNDSGHYSLSDKGQLAYKVLTEFPSNQPQTIDKRVYRAWVIFTMASITISFLTGYLFNIPLERTLTVVAILLLTTGFAFYIRIKPSSSGNRAFFIVIGAFGLGFVFWFFVTSIVMFSGLRWLIISSTGNIGDVFFVLTTLVICWIVGGFLGDLIGRKRNYIIPILRV